MDNNAQVTVVIPCTRSYERFLPAALLSCRWQTAPVNVVIVAYDLCYNAAGLEPTARDKQVDVEGPFNLSEAYNIGLAQVETQYVICLDADNVLEYQYAEKCLARADEYTIITPGWRNLEVESERWLPQTDTPSLPQFLDHNMAVTSALFPKSAWSEIGGFRDTLYLDWDFWVRCLLKEYAFVGIREPLLRYRVHAQSVTARTTDHATARRDFRKRIVDEFNLPPYLVGEPVTPPSLESPV